MPILWSLQSHHSALALAPPSSLVVSGPSAFRRALIWSQTPSGTLCHRHPRSRYARRLNANSGQSAMGMTDAACAQYSNAGYAPPPAACFADLREPLPQYAASIAPRFTGPSRA